MYNLLCHSEGFTYFLLFHYVLRWKSNHFSVAQTNYYGRLFKFNKIINFNIFLLSVLCPLSLIIVQPSLVITHSTHFSKHPFNVPGTMMAAEYVMVSKTTHTPPYHYGASRLVGETNINPKITLPKVQ